MTSDQIQRDELISRYVDGLMTEEELASFRARLSTDAALRRELVLQGEIDGALQRRLVPPKTVAVGSRVTGEAPAAGESGGVTGGTPVPRAIRGGTSVPRLRWVGMVAGAVAAAIVLVVGIDLVGGMVGPPNPARVLYAAKEKDGFAPEWVSESDAAFIEYASMMFGQPLVARPTERVEVVGWDYVPGSWSPTVGLLVAKVDETNVLLVIEPPGCGGKRLREGDVGRGLQVFSRRLGAVMVHEITPLDEPGALGLLQIP